MYSNLQVYFYSEVYPKVQVRDGLVIDMNH